MSEDHSLSPQTMVSNCNYVKALVLTVLPVFVFQLTEKSKAAPAPTLSGLSGSAPQ